MSGLAEILEENQRLRTLLTEREQVIAEREQVIAEREQVILEKDSEISQDEHHIYGEDIQKMTDEAIQIMDQLLADKEQEIMQV